MLCAWMRSEAKAFRPPQARGVRGYKLMLWIQRGFLCRHKDEKILERNRNLISLSNHEILLWEVDSYLGRTYCASRRVERYNKQGLRNVPTLADRGDSTGPLRISPGRRVCLLRVSLGRKCTRGIQTRTRQDHTQEQEIRTWSSGSPAREVSQRIFRFFHESNDAEFLRTKSTRSADLELSLLKAILESESLLVQALRWSYSGRWLLLEHADCQQEKSGDDQSRLIPRTFWRLPLVFARTETFNIFPHSYLGQARIPLSILQ